MAGLQKAPHSIDVKAGETVALCTCGLSANGRCDGAHKGTGKKPNIAVFDQDKTVYVCGCGETKEMPFCDGAHQS